jgi:hypothetical protein
MNPYDSSGCPLCMMADRWGNARYASRNLIAYLEGAKRGVDTARDALCEKCRHNFDMAECIGPRLPALDVIRAKEEVLEEEMREELGFASKRVPPPFFDVCGQSLSLADMAALAKTSVGEMETRLSRGSSPEWAVSPKSSKWRYRCSQPIAARTKPRGA